jgi:chlorophyll/bacteriochlorophyll a synthase
MARPSFAGVLPAPPALPAVVELLKPITWFPPMWAYLCGVVSAGQGFGDRWLECLAGVALAGPFVCGTSQAVNDWFDRHVDSINEPRRPIPSGRVAGRWGLGIAIGWTLVSLLVAAQLGQVVFGAAVLGLALAWAYSAPPIRLKRNGWWGNAAVGFCYEGLPWFTGAAVMTGGLPSAPIIMLAILYSLGAHGIMVLNDFKSIEGDRRTGIASLPVQLGVVGAARATCVVMLVPQLLVVALLLRWGHPLHALAVAALVAAQALMMRRFLDNPVERALWLSAGGVALYVVGMLISAFALAAGVAS